MKTIFGNQKMFVQFQKLDYLLHLPNSNTNVSLSKISSCDDKNAFVGKFSETFMIELKLIETWNI